MKLDRLSKDYAASGGHFPECSFRPPPCDDAIYIAFIYLLLFVAYLQGGNACSHLFGETGVVTGAEFHFFTAGKGIVLYRCEWLGTNLYQEPLNSEQQDKNRRNPAMVQS